MKTAISQSLAKAHQGRFIGHRVLQTQTDKAPPTQPVVDQIFALAVRQIVAVLEQTHLEEHQRRTWRMSRGRGHCLQRYIACNAFSNGVQTTAPSSHSRNPLVGVAIIRLSKSPN